jgi:DNA/RNA-binding domain of Phe-tRNA-synthetase-like protein
LLRRAFPTEGSAAPPEAIDVAPEVSGIVRPGVLAFEHVRVVERAPGMDAVLAAAAVRARSATESAEIVSAVRTMYHRVGIDPTRTRPSSEALLRRVRKGDALPRINSLVDVINWCSLETGLPFGLYDLARIRGRVVLRIGRDGEQYPGIRKDVVHVAGRLTLADDEGPFGNPTSDSARTMVTTATTRALVVIFVPAGLPGVVGDRALAVTEARVKEHCST